MIFSWFKRKKPINTETEPKKTPVPDLVLGPEPDAQVPPVPSISNGHGSSNGHATGGPAARQVTPSEPKNGVVNVICGQCGTRVTVPDFCQGHSGVCFGCGTDVQVPTKAGMEQAQALDFHPGQTIADRYELEKQLGKGGMGVVFKAQDTLIKEGVALKFMTPEYLRTQRGQRLFIQEAQMARRLRHHNIVATHDVSWTSDGILYLSMEYMQGRALRKYLNERRVKGRKVRLRLAVDIIAQVLSALEYAHRTIVHRDLKPENIMILAGDEIKVLDFGLAKVIQEVAEKEGEEDGEGASHAKKVVGTLAYAAPEQKLHQEIDHRADIYTVGLLFHELLTLRTPVDDPVTVQSVRKDVSPGILEVLEKALKEDRHERWQSASDMRSALLNAAEESYNQVAAVKTAVRGDGRQVSTAGMVLLEGGGFIMGSEKFREESPQFEAKVKPFYMDKHPVTFGQYRKYMEETGAPEPKMMRDPAFNGDDQPAVGITWHEANAYAEWAGKRLPSEAQWEFAARGQENRLYPWGSATPSSSCCNAEGELGITTNINMYESGQTPDGIFDLAGNVYEWTCDEFFPYDQKLREKARTNSETIRMTVRGGSWHSKRDELRCSNRAGVFPESALNTVGFRCVLPASGAAPDTKSDEPVVFKVNMEDDSEA